MCEQHVDHPVDLEKRRFLGNMAKVFGAFGFLGAMYPFLASMVPSVTAQAAGAPIKVKVGDMKAGEQRTVVWRGKPIWIIRRDAEMIQSLKSEDVSLRDPNSNIPQQPSYAQNALRSIKQEFLVLVGICTHLGCAPTYRPEPGAKDIGDNWPGGFFCACHGSKFDLAGRVFSGVPAPTNLEVPPYRFLDNETILVGENPTT